MGGAGITSFLHSRGATLTAAVILTVLTAIAVTDGDVIPIEGNRGLLYPSTNTWLSQGWASAIASLCVTMVVAAAASALNKRYNIMRSLTSLWATMYIVMVCGFPSICGQFSGATLLPAIFVIASALLYRTYDNPGRRRSLFLIFFILSGASLFQYGYMFYIPVFAIGMIQMKVMNLKSLLAAAMGVITPPWVLFGSGLADIDSVQWPEFVNSLTVIESRDKILLLAGLGFTALLGVGFFMGNVMKLLSYNARNRAFNGFPAIGLIFTIIFIVVDYHNLALYSSLLCLLTAYQAAHFFSSRRQPQSYIVILTLMASYYLLYIFAL